MEKDKLIELIDIALEEVAIYINKRKGNIKEQEDVVLVLNLIKNDYCKKDFIREVYLRGFKDICTSTAVHFENSNYADSIFHILDLLNEKYSNMEELKLLGNEFKTLQKKIL